MLHLRRPVTPAAGYAGTASKGTATPAIKMARSPIVNSPVVPPPKEPQPPGAPLRDTPMSSIAEGAAAARDPLRRPLEPQPPAAPVPRSSRKPGGRGRSPGPFPARCVVLDEFLAPQELEELTRIHVGARGCLRAPAKSFLRSANGGVVNYEHRRSRVSDGPGEASGIDVGAHRTALPQVLGNRDGAVHHCGCRGAGYSQ